MNQTGRPAAAPAREQRLRKERREMEELLILIIKKMIAFQRCFCQEQLTRVVRAKAVPVGAPYALQRHKPKNRVKL
jgi:hypothetical protein